MSINYGLLQHMQKDQGALGTSSETVKESFRLNEPISQHIINNPIRSRQPLTEIGLE
jgi:hypothetical protein